MATFIPAPDPSAFSVVPSYESAPFVNGFRLIVTGNTTLTVGPGTCRALCNNNIIQFPNFTAGFSGPATVDVSTVGANGCFPVSIVSLGLTHKTMFPVYAIKSSSGTGLGAANSNAGGTTTNTYSAFIVATGNNFLPAGYDTFQRIGWVYIDNSTSHLIQMTQSGNGNERVYVLSDPFVALSAGSATTATVIDLTASDGPIPPGANIEVLLNAEITPNAADGYVYLEAGLATATGAMSTQIFGSVAAHKNSAVANLIATPNASTGNAEVKYLVDNAGSASTINVIGFIDSIGNSLV